MSEPIDIWTIARERRSIANQRLCDALMMRPISSAKAISAMAKADLAVSDADVDLLFVSHVAHLIEIEQGE